MIRPYLREEPDLLALHPQIDEKSVAVELLQQHLIDLGYLHEAASGWFGPATKTALMSFLDDMHLAEPSEELTSIAAAYLIAANARKKNGIPSQASSNGEVRRQISLPRSGRSDFSDTSAGARTATTTMHSSMPFLYSRKIADWLETLRRRALVASVRKNKTNTSAFLAPEAHRASCGEIIACARSRSGTGKRGDVLAEFLAEGDRGAEVKNFSRSSPIAASSRVRESADCLAPSRAMQFFSIRSIGKSLKK